MMKKGFVFSLLVSTALTSACRDKVDVQTNIQDVVDAIGHRTKKISTYEYKGSAQVEGVDKAILFDFSSQPPDRLRLNITSSEVSYLLVGKVLSVINHKTKTVGRQDLSSKDPATILQAVNQVFGDYMCEGYKPVLVPAANAKVTEVQGQWRVKAPLEDAELKEVEITFNTPNADFVSKRFVDKSGAEVMKLKVLEESAVPNSKIRVPKRWQKTQGTKSYEVSLTKVQINQKIDASRFSTEIPEGYKLQEFGK